ncbi:MAG: PIN domain-containing protein, partial [Phycisphaeraceae bacterium]
GFALGKRRDDNERVLTAFLKLPHVSVIAPDELTTRHYADLYRQTRDQGAPIPTNELWIAALAIQHDLILYTRDRHFHQFSQLRRC